MQREGTPKFSLGYQKMLQNEGFATIRKSGLPLAIGIITMNPILIAKTNCQASKPSSVRVFAMTTGAALILIAGATSSCATFRGVGRDVETGGEKIQNAATAAQR